jgi:small-conductance mechanosensitive channel
VFTAFLTEGNTVTEDKLKSTLGILLVIAHFLVILLVVVFYFLEAFLFEEMTTTLALIIPMFAVYTTAIVKSIIENRNIEHNPTVPVRNVTNSFVFISLVIPVLFTLFVLALVVLKAFNVGFDKFEQFKILIGLTETIFGIYVGQIIGSLFDKSKMKKSVMKKQKSVT